MVKSPGRVNLWDTDTRGWHALTGGTVLIARGLGDIRLTAPVPTD